MYVCNTHIRYTHYTGDHLSRPVIQHPTARLEAMAESGKWRTSEEGKYESRLGQLYFYLLGVALKVAKKI